MKKIYLHIGTAKTGSSALQAFCYENAKVLESKGIYYPLEYGGAPFNNFFLSGGNLGPLILEKNNHDDELVEAIAGLLERHDVLLLSSEYLWDHFDYRMEIFDGLSKLPCEVDIIVYLRPQIDFIESMYREAVENLYSIYVSLDDFIEAVNPYKISEASDQEASIQRIVSGTRYYERITKLCHIFGKEHIHVKIYEKSQMKDQSIYADFLDVLGIEIDDSFTYPNGRINPTIDSSLVDIRRQINSLKGYTSAEKQDVFRNMIENISANKSINGDIHFKSCINNEKWNMYMKWFEIENSKIATEFCGRKDGMLFREQRRNDFEPESTNVHEMLADSIKLFSSLALEQNRVNSEIRNFISELNKKVQVYRETELNDIRKEIMQIKQNNLELQQTLLERTTELNAMKESTCWKLTKPVRWLLDCFRKSKNT